MIVNIAGLNAGMGRSTSFSFEVSAEELDAVMDGCTFDGLIAVEGTVINAGSCYRAEGIIGCRKSFTCDRCLASCTVEQRHEFSEKFRRVADGTSEEEEAVFFEGDTIDIAGMIRDTLLAAQPLSNICSPDCKGLCPVCGTNLNHGTCTCDSFVPDPRLAALQRFMQKQENE